MDPFLKDDMSALYKKEIVTSLSIDITKKVVILVSMCVASYFIGEDISHSINGIRRVKNLGKN